jgi:ketosteroid isomerase-like protein
MTIDTRELAVREATQRWLDATVRADAYALDRMLDPGYTFTHATTAITDTREEWLESFRSGQRRYKRWDISDVSVRLFPGTAIMTGRGHQEVVRADGIFDLRTSFTNVWIEQDGNWKLAVWQATLVPSA